MSERIPIERSSIVRISSEIILALSTAGKHLKVTGKSSDPTLYDTIFLTLTISFAFPDCMDHAIVNTLELWLCLPTFLQSNSHVGANGKISSDVLINNSFHHSHWHNFSLQYFPKCLYSPFLFYFALLYFSVHLSSTFSFCSSIFLSFKTDVPVLYNFLFNFLNVRCLSLDQKLLFLLYIIPAPIVALL